MHNKPLFVSLYTIYSFDLLLALKRGSQSSLLEVLANHTLPRSRLMMMITGGMRG
jgi:hypothetical protein